MKRRSLLIVCVICAGLVLLLLLKGSGLFPAMRHLWNEVALRVDTITGATRLAKSPVEITGKSTHDALTFDASKRKYSTISYHLSKPAWARIRIVQRGQKELVHRTLLDWSAKDKGQNTEKWDGKDSSGNLIDNRRCFVIFEADSKQHREHDWKKCRELRIKPISPAKTVPVSGIHKLRVMVNKKARGYGDISGYEVRWYVDYELVHETSYEGGVLGPFDFAWDTMPFEDGEHLITVVVDDNNDHMGSASVKVEVQNK